MSSDTSSKSLDSKNKKELNQFIKSGGRNGALKDFNLVVKKAVGEKK
jgi:hypothetical protein